jgi:hypothetical protein
MEELFKTALTHLSNSLTTYTIMRSGGFSLTLFLLPVLMVFVQHFASKLAAYIRRYREWPYYDIDVNFIKDNEQLLYCMTKCINKEHPDANKISVANSVLAPTSRPIVINFNGSTLLLDVSLKDVKKSIRNYNGSVQIEHITQYRLSAATTNIIELYTDYCAAKYGDNGPNNLKVYTIDNRTWELRNVNFYGTRANIIMNKESKDLLNQLLDTNALTIEQKKRLGLSTRNSVFIAGSKGDGKSWWVRIAAKHLKRPLYIVDAVTSASNLKYALHKIKSNSIVLFDEMDCFSLDTKAKYQYILTKAGRDKFDMTVENLDIYSAENGYHNHQRRGYWYIRNNGFTKQDNGEVYQTDAFLRTDDRVLNDFINGYNQEVLESFYRDQTIDDDTPMISRETINATASDTTSDTAEKMQIILKFLDGYESADNLLIVGISNYIDKIDSRILRCGRFDTKVKVTDIRYDAICEAIAYFYNKPVEDVRADIPNNILPIMVAKLVTYVMPNLNDYDRCVLDLLNDHYYDKDGGFKHLKGMVSIAGHSDAEWRKIDADKNAGERIRKRLHDKSPRNGSSIESAIAMSDNPMLVRLHDVCSLASS